jgi:uncharacterized protein YndB with AHSA1/START domain
MQRVEISHDFAVPVERVYAHLATVTRAVPNELIEYRITKGGVLRDHLGTMRFSPEGAGSRLHYVIEFGAVLPGFDRVVQRSLERSVPKGLRQVEANA